MGQENSSQEHLNPNVSPSTLSAQTIEAVAEFVNDGHPKRIVVMAGAGISTSAGIPDFRSPDTGLYSNLASLGLPYPEAVFDISYFRKNPEPFYKLAKELYPGKFFPTIAHAFIALLARKQMLEMAFTQNIDTLERRAGVPGDKIVEAHGSFASQRCIECKTEYPDDLMLQAVETGSVPHCTVPECNGLVKPDIVFFGESLPEAFSQNSRAAALADLAIVMGTSLSVYPFASLPQNVRYDVPRVLFNLEVVGDFGHRLHDVIVLGDCDEGVRKFADALGWRDELEELWFEVCGKNKEKELAELRAKREEMSKDEKLKADIESLTGEVDKALRLSNDHIQRVNDHLDKTSTEDQPPQPATKAAANDSENSRPKIHAITIADILKRDRNRFDFPSTPSVTSSEDPLEARSGLKEPSPTPVVSKATPETSQEETKASPAENPEIATNDFDPESIQSSQGNIESKSNLENKNHGALI